MYPRRCRVRLRARRSCDDDLQVCGLAALGSPELGGEAAVMRHACESAPLPAAGSRQALGRPRAQPARTSPSKGASRDPAGRWTTAIPVAALVGEG